MRLPPAFQGVIRHLPPAMRTRATLCSHALSVPVNRFARRTQLSMDDSQLVAAALEGHPVAERSLYDRHVERVFRLAYRAAGDDTLVRDFTQDTFIRAFGKLAGFRGDASLATWLHAIATSVILNGLKKVRRIRSREIECDELPEIAVTRREAEWDLKLKLARAIDALPEGYRLVFVMRDVEGYTCEGIGSALGVQPGTSKAQLFRARARLRNELAELAELAEFAGEWAARAKRTTIGWKR